MKHRGDTFFLSDEEYLDCKEWIENINNNEYCLYSWHTGIGSRCLYFFNKNLAMEFKLTFFK
jgi:hypothetical protein